jgi:hypothetical protein|tara:strand:- start:447 stop:965 length:519 start_codon:yes stop_codon:yes gene_type:complete
MKFEPPKDLYIIFISLHKMGKKILLTIIFVLILLIVGTFFIFFNNDSEDSTNEIKLEKKELGLNNVTDGDRRSIANHDFDYYDDSCNNWEGGYYTYQDCLDLFECMAYEYAQNLPEQDVSDLLDVMTNEGNEKGLVYYSQKNPSYGRSINFESNECARGRYKDYTEGGQVVI